MTKAAMPAKYIREPLFGWMPAEKIQTMKYGHSTLT